MEYYIVYFQRRRNGESGVGGVTIKSETPITDDIIHDLQSELKKEDKLAECFIVNAIPLTNPIKAFIERLKVEYAYRADEYKQTNALLTKNDPSINCKRVENEGIISGLAEAILIAEDVAKDMGVE